MAGITKEGEYAGTCVVGGYHPDACVKFTDKCDHGVKLVWVCDECEGYV